ncbi:unnamed protein product, partial [Polarella glacialis]
VQPPSAGAAAESSAASPSVARVGPLGYTKPDWAGKPSLEGEVAIELIVRGEVKKRIPLDVQNFDAFLIGREGSCDVVLEGFEKRASRYHCILQCKAGSPELYAYDLKSSHGTVLNGQRIDPNTFVPVRVGGQLRFNAERPGPFDCLAVLCGPEEAMEEEGEIDLTEFRELAAKEREEAEKAMLQDLEKRKMAKRLKMNTEGHRQAVAKAYANKAQKRMDELKVTEKEDKEKLHQVNWGMGEDAVEIPTEDVSEESQKLMDISGRIDLEKVRKLGLTEKQEQLVAKLENKNKKIGNLHKAKSLLEEQASTRLRKMAEAEKDIDEMKPDRGAGSQNLEKLQKLEEKLEKAEEDFTEQVDNLLLSLGFKKSGMGEGKISKRRAAMYETNLNEEDDEYYDRTAGPSSKPSDETAAEADDIPSELMGLPVLAAVENKKSLETKIAQLKAEQAKLSSNIATELIKEKHRKAQEEAEDSLDAFMNGIVAEVRQDRGDKLEKRLAVVESRLAEMQAMLVIAQTNSDEPSPAPKASSAAAGSSSASTPSAPSSKVKRAAPATDDAEAEGEAEGTRRERSSAPAAPGSVAEAMARLLKKAAADGDVKEGPVIPESAAVAAVAAMPPPSQAPKRKAGPERPSAALLAQAAAIVVAAPAEEEPGLRKPARGPPKERIKNSVSINPTQAGLQVLSQQAADADDDDDDDDDDEELMPPPAKNRKVYGRERPPARMASSSRDCDVGDSGELGEPDG